MSAQITFKRGSTFSYSGMVELPVGTWSAAAHIRTPNGDLIQALTVTLTPPVNPSTEHTLLLEATAAQTLLWPCEKLEGDVVFTDASVTPVVVPTGTFTVEVREKVTR